MNILFKIIMLGVIATAVILLISGLYDIRHILLEIRSLQIEGLKIIWWKLLMFFIGFVGGIWAIIEYWN